MKPKDMARSNGYGRIAAGTGLMLAPELTARVWLGDDASTAGAKVAVRALGIRDIALGAGLVLALQNRDPARMWVLGAVAADAIDAAATIIAWDKLPRAGRVAVLALAAGSAVQMGLLAQRVK